MTLIYELETDIFVDVIFNAIEKDSDQLIWEKWLAFSPHMETQKPFSEYKADHFKGSNEDTNELTDEELIADAESIINGTFAK